MACVSGSVSLQPSTGTTEVSNGPDEATDDRDEPSLAISHPEATSQQGYSRQSELPSGDSVALRLARRVGLR